MASIVSAFSSKGWPAAGDGTSVPVTFSEDPSGYLATGIEIGQFVAVDDLQVLEAGAVVQLDEGEILRFALGADPAAHFQLLIQQLFVMRRRSF